MNKYEHDRIERVFNWVQRKLNTKYNLIFEQFNAEKDLYVSKDTHLCVERSSRDTEDPDSFIIYFDITNTKIRSFKILKQDAFHELTHVINWMKRDIFEETLSHIKSNPIKKGLRKRFYDADEAATYLMERAVGPFIIKGYRKDD